MSLSLYDITVPVYIRGLRNLSAIVKKGQDHIQSTNQSESTILEARLIEDMENFIYQIQRVSDSAKGVATRIGGAESVAMEDNEKSFADVYARIEKTIAYLEKVDKKGFEGKEDTEVVLQSPKGAFKFTGKSFVLDFSIPNFFFHETMAYALLRKMGVPVGKLDFLGPIQQ